jgi:hypothetical protein
MYWRCEIRRYAYHCYQAKLFWRVGRGRQAAPLAQRRPAGRADPVAEGLAPGYPGDSLLHPRHDCSSSFMGYWDAEVMCPPFAPLCPLSIFVPLHGTCTRKPVKSRE